MKMENGDKLRVMLTLHEDDRQFPYGDADGRTLRPGSIVNGNVTIGIGRNLTGKGLSEPERQLLFGNDLADIERQLSGALPWTSAIDPVRKCILADMCFNMGINRLLAFTRTLSLIRTGRYVEAAGAMLDSLWAKQVGQRAIRLAKMMESGVWYTT